MNLTHDEGACVVCDEVRRGHLGHRPFFTTAQTRALAGLGIGILGIIAALGFLLAVWTAIDAARFGH